MTNFSNEGCASGCYWNGSSVCSLCGARLRCFCGVYVREDNLESHETRCRVLAGVVQADALIAAEIGRWQRAALVSEDTP